MKRTKRIKKINKPILNDVDFIQKFLFVFGRVISTYVFRKFIIVEYFEFKFNGKDAKPLISLDQKPFFKMFVNYDDIGGKYRTKEEAMQAMHDMKGYSKISLNKFIQSKYFVSCEYQRKLDKENYS